MRRQTSRGKEVLDVSRAETEAVVEPDDVADDSQQETIAVAGRLAVHRAIAQGETRKARARSSR